MVNLLIKKEVINGKLLDQDIAEESMMNRKKLKTSKGVEDVERDKKEHNQLQMEFKNLKIFQVILIQLMKLPRLARTNLRSSSILKEFRLSSAVNNIEFVFHILPFLVKIRLHTKNQLPWLPGTALKASVGGVEWVVWCEWNTS